MWVDFDINKHDKKIGLVFLIIFRKHYKFYQQKT